MGFSTKLGTQTWCYIADKHQKCNLKERKTKHSSSKVMSPTGHYKCLLFSVQFFPEQKHNHCQVNSFSKGFPESQIFLYSNGKWLFLNDGFSGLKYSSLNPATTSATKEHAVILTIQRKKDYLLFSIFSVPSKTPNTTMHCRTDYPTQHCGNSHLA